MKLNSFFILSVILLFTFGCTSSNENNAENKIDSSSEEEDTQVSSELLKEKFNYLYSINDINYNVDTLPELYTKVSGKKRKLFLDSYLNHKLVLDTLTNEQVQYKKLIDSCIDEELKKREIHGVAPDDLEKKILIQDITLRTVAREELANKESNLTAKIKQFYVDNKNDYIYPNHAEVSYIVSNDLNESKRILLELKKDKVTIKRFANFAKKNTLDMRLKAGGGYAGFVSKKLNGKEFFKPIWSSRNLGLIDKVLTKDEYFYIVYIHKKIEAGISKFEDVKDDIRKHLIHRGFVNKWINLKFNQVMKTTKVKIYDSFDSNISF